MKRIATMCVAALFVVLISTNAFGQTLVDSFSDGDFTANPVWSGDSASWTIVANSDAAAGATGSNTLRLNFTTAAAGTQHLSTQVVSWGNEQEWGFWVGRRAQAFTAGNQMMIWLYANEADLESATVDGYRLLIGDDTGNDDIFLQSVTDGVGTTIFTSSGAITNGVTDIGFLIRVTRDSLGLFSIYTSTLPTVNGAGAVATDIPNATNANVSQGSVTNTSFTPTSYGYLGVVALHTSAAAPRAAVEFDQIYFTIAPTAAKMSGFTAKSSNKRIELQWTTGFEVNNLGFNLYRDHRGKRIPINPSIIAGSALMAAPGIAMTAGNSYSWIDPAGTSDSVYYLEDIDVNGTRTMRGPIIPSAGASSVSTKPGRAILLDELNASTHENKIVQRSQRGWAFSSSPHSSANPLSDTDSSGSVTRTAPSDSGSQVSATATFSSSQDKQKALAAMPGLKLSVREDGWYLATQAELVAAGLNPNADMRYLQLYADGVEIPIVINSSKPTGALKAGDSISFYAVALDTPTADTRDYWLVSGSTLGKRIKAQALKSINSSGALQSFEYTVERKERLLYFSGLLNGETENFFGQVINSAPITQMLSVEHLSTSTTATARLEVALQGVTLQDHVVRVLVNGREVGVLNFTGQQNKVEQLPLSAGVLREGDNTITLERTNGATDISLLDYVRLNYAHTYQADNDYLQFTVNGRAQVRGFSVAGVVLLDITDPNSASLFNPRMEKAAAGYCFTLQTSESRTFLAFTDQKVRQFAAVTRNQPSNWSSNGQGADFIVITHRDFRNSVEPLAQLHRNEGMSVAVVDVEDVYDEFSYGAHNARAIRDFLEWTQTHWLRAPRFVLLVGDGSFDPHNYLGDGETDILPAHLIDTALLETVSDDWFVDFDNDGVGEMALGRLPVRTAIEAETIISRIVNYSPANTLQTAMMVADRTDAKTNFNFAAASDELGSLLPATIGTQKIYRGDNAASVIHDQIVSGVNQGPLLVNFIGHGSVEVWTGDPILSTSDAAVFNNGARLPVFLMMTCLNGYYQNPARESLAESLVRTNAGGAIAVWASSGMTEPAPQFDMSTALYRQLFGSQPITLGEAIRSAKRGNSDIDVRRTWILFGDPAMRLQ